MKKYFLVFTTALSFLFSCKKSDTTATTADTYLPNSIGSNWTYQITTPPATVNTVKFTVSNRDTTANSKSYNVITGSNGTNQYYNKTGNDYFTLRTVGTSGSLELLFLKDNVNAGATWNTSQVLTGLTGLPGGITSVTIVTAYTLQEKGSTRTILTKLYTDVIKVRADLSATVPLFGSLSFGFAEFYFSKNIGLIESNIQIANPAAGININEVYRLQSHEIK